MKSFSYVFVASLALMSSNSFAAAQTVYRCGDTYSQTPCANGSVVKADDPRDDSQRAAAQTALSRDKTLVKDIEASRRKDEAEALAQNKAALARAHAAHNKPDAEPKKVVTESKAAPKKKASAKASGKREVRVKGPEAGVFTASVPSEKPKKKTRKSAASKP